MSSASDDILESGGDDGDVARTAAVLESGGNELVALLERRHQHEIERLTLQLTDRVRAAEYGRMNVDLKLSELSELRHEESADFQCRLDASTREAADREQLLRTALVDAGQLRVELRSLELERLADREARAREREQAQTRFDSQQQQHVIAQREMAQLQQRFDALNREHARNCTALTKLQQRCDALLLDGEKGRATTARLAKELSSERTVAAALKGQVALLDSEQKQLQSEQQKLQRALDRARAHAHAVASSISFQLGTALVSVVTSWSGLFLLPRRLWTMVTSHRRVSPPDRLQNTPLAVPPAALAGDPLPAAASAFVDVPIDDAADVLAEIASAAVTDDIEPPVALPAGRNSFDAEQRVQFEDALKSALERTGVDGMLALADAQGGGRSERFQAFCRLRSAALLLQMGEVDAAARAAESAVDLAADDTTTLRSAAQILLNADCIDAAAGILDRLPAPVGPGNDSEQRLRQQVQAHRQLQAEAQQHQPAAFEPREKRVLYFLHFSLPYTSVGYSTRSHGIARGVGAVGWTIVPYTRPGFPVDFKPELEGVDLPASDLIDGVEYHRILDGGRRGRNEVDYLLEAADRCEAVIREQRPAIVHAASSYTTALPALIAARRLGVPFVYEVRGFWEITRSSRDAAFERSVRYRQMQRMEDLVCQQADRIITITSAMSEELAARGTDAGKLAVAYNSVDPDRFTPLARDEGLAEQLAMDDDVPVIGYVGSFVDYEGLDDLVAACGLLHTQGLAFRLLLVGDGAELPAIEQAVRDHGLEHIAVITGRVPHDDVERYYSLIDVCPFPRKPWQVCELVSPLKPFEAMAMEKAVVASNTRALAEIVSDGENGLLFEKGSTASLADALRRLVSDRTLRQQLGAAGRRWVIAHRSWVSAGQAVADCYDALVSVHAE